MSHTKNQITIDKQELLSKLKSAERELDLLYHFAISHGIPEAGDPPHKQIGRYIKELQKENENV